MNSPLISTLQIGTRLTIQASGALISSLPVNWLMLLQAHIRETARKISLYLFGTCYN